MFLELPAHFAVG